MHFKLKKKGEECVNLKNIKKIVKQLIKIQTIQQSMIKN